MNKIKTILDVHKKTTLDCLDIDTNTKLNRLYLIQYYKNSPNLLWFYSFSFKYTNKLEPM